MGHRLDASEQGGEQMPIPVRCDARKGKQVGGAAGRTRAFLETARASSKTCTGKLWSRKGSKNRERSVRNRLGSTSSSLREILSSSSSSSFYRSRRSRSALNAYLPYPSLFDPPRYIIRLHVLLGAHVREEPVHTPWRSNSSLGRFSSRHRIGRPSSKGSGDYDREGNRRIYGGATTEGDGESENRDGKEVG